MKLPVPADSNDPRRRALIAEFIDPTARQEKAAMPGNKAFPVVQRSACRDLRAGRFSRAEPSAKA
jgi:hypothetical protein